MKLVEYGNFKNKKLLPIYDANVRFMSTLVIKKVELMMFYVGARSMWWSRADL